MMFYTVSFILSLICISFTSALAINLSKTYKSTRIMTPSRVLAIGVFASAWFLLFPYYYIEVFSDISFLPRIWESVWVTVHHVIRFFVVDADFGDIQNLGVQSGMVSYTILGTILLILAPLLTFSVILSFFQNFSAYRKYLMHPNSATYVFSELNEKALALARDLKNNHPDSIIIFTDVFADNNEESFEIIERAKEIGAICFKKDMLSLNLRFHSKNSLLCFFAIAEERSVRGMYRHMLTSTTAEEENLKQAHKLAANKFYSNRANTQLFVFSTGTQGELLIDNLPETKISVRRVNHFKQLIIRTLHENGKELLFDRALPTSGGEKQINAVIIGAGGYGTEMIKTLAWYCQMDGYRINIDAFDVDPLACEKLEFECPGLMSPENNGNNEDGHACYNIRFHDGISVDTGVFSERLGSIEWPTYIFVSLGSDELNVNTAVTVRRIFRQLGCPYDPFIHAIVYDSENKKVLEGATNLKGESYDIHYIGDLSQTYSERVVINEELGSEALSMHMKYSDSEFKYDYHVRSSVAAALHRELCVELGVFPKEIDGLSEQERYRMEKLEHRRWQAYMFAEGYVYGRPQNGRIRDDIAKIHSELVPHDMLPSSHVGKDPK